MPTLGVLAAGLVLMAGPGVAAGQVVVRGAVGGLGPWTTGYFPGSHFVRVTRGGVRSVVPIRWHGWWSCGVPIDGPFPPPTGPVDPRLTVGGQALGLDMAPGVDEPASAIDEGWGALSRGEPRIAVARFVERLNEEPADAEALRAFGLGLLAQGDTALAAGPIRTAYAMAPELGMILVPVEAFGGRAELRRLVVRAVRHGHEVGSASAWLVAAVLAQFEGRAVADRFLGWSESAGLEPETARWVRLGLAESDSE